MAPHFAQRLIYLRSFCFTPQPFAKLGFDHAESGFDVASFVVGREKFFALETVVMEKAKPKLRATFTRCVRLERNVRCCAVVYHSRRC